MRILIMRHGEAVLLRSGRDMQRSLTQKGRDESMKMASWLIQHAIPIEYILVSPYQRAQQTLAAVSQIISLNQVKSETLSILTPNSDPVMVASYLHNLALQGVETVMIIAHLPLIGYLVSELCPEEPPPMFATSALVQVSLNPSNGQGTFDWYKGPAQLT